MIVIREEGDVTRSKELIQKESEYLHYIQEHIRFVKESFYELFLRNEELKVKYPKLNPYIEKVRFAVQEHDASKFSDDEFYDYRLKYYPTKDEEDRINSDEVFADTVNDNYNNKAWVHHVLCNDHHPEHWKCENGEFHEDATPKDMSLDAIIHMICDWEAMSKKFHTNTYEWYQNQCDCKEHMSEKTIRNLEILLEFLYVKQDRKTRS